MPGPLVSEVAAFATSAQVGGWAILGTGLALVVFQLWAIVDVLVRPAEVWSSSGLSQVSWVLRVVILGLFGATWYVISARPKLRAAKRALRATPTGSREP